jgi:pimeloyl-ACP methyl ester carboxylesterase
MSTVTQAPTAPAAVPVAHPRGIGEKILRAGLRGLKWAALGILLIVTALLIGVSLRWGPTPPLVAGALAAGWAGLIALLVGGPRRWGRGRAQAGAALGAVALALLTVAASQIAAYTPPIVDAQGRPVPGSLAVLEQVRLNGADEWISIRARDPAAPVLLWLAGGPGGSQLATVRYHLGALEDRFVVVNWEQPGAGKSYHAVAHGSLTRDRYVADGLALAEHLRARFGQAKIYLAGESWGSALGLWMVQQRPDLFHAFIGTGQMVDFVATERADYDFALALARQRGDAQKVAGLQRQGPPPYSGAGTTMKQAAYLLDGFNYMNSDPAIANDDGFDTFKDILSPEYGLYDKVNWARGVLDSGDVLFPQLWQAGVDLRKDVPVVQVPVYFLVGRHDVNAPPALAADYYRTLRAPHKEWVWFERSGHNPWVTESARFAEVILTRVLPAPDAAR